MQFGEGLCGFLNHVFYSMQMPGRSRWIPGMEGKEIQTMTSYLTENTNLHLYPNLILVD